MTRKLDDPVYTIYTVHGQGTQDQSLVSRKYCLVFVDATIATSRKLAIRYVRDRCKLDGHYYAIDALHHDPKKLKIPVAKNDLGQELRLYAVYRVVEQDKLHASQDRACLDLIRRGTEEGERSDVEKKMARELRSFLAIPGSE